MVTLPILTWRLIIINERLSRPQHNFPGSCWGRDFADSKTLQVSARVTTWWLPLYGGTVPYFWLYFVGIFCYIGLKNRPYTFFHNPLCLAGIYMHKQREFPFKRVASSASNVITIYVLWYMVGTSNLGSWNDHWRDVYGFEWKNTWESANFPVRNLGWN